MLREISIFGKFNEVVEALVDSQPQSDGATLRRANRQHQVSRLMTLADLFGVSRSFLNPVL